MNVIQTVQLEVPEHIAAIIAPHLDESGKIPLGKAVNLVRAEYYPGRSFRGFP